MKKSVIKMDADYLVVMAVGTPPYGPHGVKATVVDLNPPSEDGLTDVAGRTSNRKRKGGIQVRLCEDYQSIAAGTVVVVLYSQVIEEWALRHDVWRAGGSPPYDGRERDWRERQWA